MKRHKKRCFCHLICKNTAEEGAKLLFIYDSNVIFLDSFNSSYVIS